MPIDAGTLATLLASLSTVAVWLVAQTQAKSRAQRKELRWRREMDIMKDRYQFRLEKKLAQNDIELPEKPVGMGELEKQEW